MPNSVENQQFPAFFADFPIDFDLVVAQDHGFMSESDWTGAGPLAD